MTEVKEIPTETKETDLQTYEVYLEKGKVIKKLSGYYDNKKKKFEWNYLEEKPHGKFLTWYENGQKKSDRTYENGVITAYDYFEENGKKRDVYVVRN
jgi:antitoxin component YwqK of YwqJK toxin-antitoxin module